MTTINQAIISAETAATDRLNSYLNGKCKEVVDEKSLFDLQMKEKTFDVFVTISPYGFKTFSRANRPKGASCILELIKADTFEENQYRIVVKPNATSEMIEAALTMLVLPF